MVILEAVLLFFTSVKYNLHFVNDTRSDYVNIIYFKNDLGSFKMEKKLWFGKAMAWNTFTSLCRTVSLQVGFQSRLLRQNLNSKGIKTCIFTFFPPTPFIFLLSVDQYFETYNFTKDTCLSEIVHKILRAILGAGRGRGVPIRWNHMADLK